MDNNDNKLTATGDSEIVTCKLTIRKIPAIPKLPDVPYDPNPTVAICGECGLEIKLVMSYCCQNPRCPTGLGGRILCGTS